MAALEIPEVMQGVLVVMAAVALGAALTVVAFLAQLILAVAAVLALTITRLLVLAVLAW